MVCGTVGGAEITRLRLEENDCGMENHTQKSRASSTGRFSNNGFRDQDLETWDPND